MTDKERLLAAGRIDHIGRGRVSRADREWLDANPEPSGTRQSTSTAKVVAEIPPPVWPDGTVAVSLLTGKSAGPNECCGTCGVWYRYCQCHDRPGRPAPQIIVGTEYHPCRLEAPE